MYLGGLWLKRSWGSEVRNVTACWWPSASTRRATASCWRQCVVHFYRNIWRAVPSGKSGEVAEMLKAIHAQEDREAACQKAEAVVAKLQQMKQS